MAARTTTSTAVLLALAEDDHGEVACLLTADGRTLLARLVGQLTAVGVQHVIVFTRPQWAAAVAQAADVTVEAYGSVPAMLDRLAELARATAADLLVAHADVLTHDAALANLVLDSRVRTGVLSGVASSPLLGPPMRVTDDRVVASGSAYHRCEPSNAHLLGMCKVGHADVDRVAPIVHELATLLASGPPEAWCAELERMRAALAAEVTVDGGRASAEHAVAAVREDPLPLVVVGLVRRDVPVTPVAIRGLYWGRPRTAGAAVTAVEDLRRIDEERVRLDAAVKDVDGFFTTFFVSPYSRYIARWAARRGLTPNQVTVASMVLGVAAAAAFAAGSRASLVAGALLLQLAFIADCVDGQLARYTRTHSAFGAWLDSMLDRGKEYVVYAGLAIGATVAPAVDGRAAAGIWLMATAALTLQTVRHHADFSHGAQRLMNYPPRIRYPLDAAAGPPAEEPAHDAVSDAPARSTRAGAHHAAISALVRFGGRPWVTWVKRILVLPIGERFALISVTAAVWDARVTFAALLAWGTVATAYTTTTRILRPIS